jgi:hypothetical protein
MKTLLSIFVGLLLISGCVDSSELVLTGLTEEWIKTSPTYQFDGDNLTFISYEIQEDKQVLVYRFTSSQAGYGDRSDEVVAQVFTDHTIEIHIVDREIVSAVIDGVWDELEQNMISESIIMNYQPMQCQELPWDSDIIEYYESYGIEIISAERVETDRIVCTACDICPTAYYYTAEVYSEYVEELELLGWKA